MSSRKIFLALLVTLTACAGASDDASSGSADLSDVGPTTTEVVPLGAEDRMSMAVKKTTCPFAGTAVATGALKVLDSAARPLAFVADVMALGDLGGGDLGTKVLQVFARGNHVLMRGGEAPKLDTAVPSGTFSLDFPGSHGSHPGHSGILESDPDVLDSGRFDPTRLAALQGRATDGHIRRSDVGRFIAADLVADPRSKVFGSGVAKLLGADIRSFVARRARL